jgi:hypothetical protein
MQSYKIYSSLATLAKKSVNNPTGDLQKWLWRVIFAVYYGIHAPTRGDQPCFSDYENICIQRNT